jgi:hypothetical protein
MKHIADPSSRLLVSLVMGVTAVEREDMSGFFGVGICFDTFLFFSVNKDTRGFLLVFDEA